MRVEGFIWLLEVVDKLESKHSVTVSEVESVFTHRPLFSKIEKGNIKGEDVYRALGQSEAGRYLAVFFIYKKSHEALIISARDMKHQERKHYGERKK